MLTHQPQQLKCPWSISQKDRAVLANDLCHMTNNASLTKRERLVCVVLFALTLSRYPDYMYEQEPGTLDRYVLDVENIDEEMLSESCTLWVALIVASMQLCFRLSQSARWALLNRVLAKQNAPARPWSEMRPVVSDFCITDALGKQWETCWSFATRSCR